MESASSPPPAGDTISVIARVRALGSGAQAARSKVVVNVPPAAGAAGPATTLHAGGQAFAFDAVAPSVASQVGAHTLLKVVPRGARRPARRADAGRGARGCAADPLARGGTRGAGGPARRAARACRDTRGMWREHGNRAAAGVPCGTHAAARTRGCALIAPRRPPQP
jgi:hypothetical protein